MTNDEIMALDLDELRMKIAESFGWTNIHKDGYENNLYGFLPNGKPSFIPDWPRDIAAAWELVQNAQAKPDQCFFSIEHTPSIPHKGKPCWHVEMGRIFAHGHTAPEAICRAWLMWRNAANGR